MPKIEVSQEAFQTLLAEAKAQGTTMRDLASSCILMILSEEEEEEGEEEEEEEEEEK